MKKLKSVVSKRVNTNAGLKKKNLTDAVFGIWKNENITIEKIREKAWQRTK